MAWYRNPCWRFWLAELAESITEKPREESESIRESQTRESRAGRPAIVQIYTVFALRIILQDRRQGTKYLVTEKQGRFC